MVRVVAIMVLQTLGGEGFRVCAAQRALGFRVDAVRAYGMDSCLWQTTYRVQHLQGV